MPAPRAKKVAEATRHAYTMFIIIPAFEERGKEKTKEEKERRTGRAFAADKEGRGVYLWEKVR